MKKIISFFLAALMLCGMLVLPSAAAEKIFTDNQTWHSSWNTEYSPESTFAFSPAESGYYSLNVSAGVKKGKLSDGSFEIYITDRKEYEEEVAYSNYYVNGVKAAASGSFSNIYLLKGHTYDVECFYWNETTITVDLTFKPKEYTPGVVSSEKTTLTVKDNAVEWLEFTAGEAGDYSFNVTGIKDCSFDIFDSSKVLIVDMYEFEDGSFKARLKAGEKYLISVYLDDQSVSSEVTISAEKCEKDITKVEINKTINKIWIGSRINGEDFEYKVTYSDGTSEILSYEDTNFNIYIDYLGKISETGMDEYLVKGTQKVRINYLFGCSNEDKITVCGALDMVAGKTAIKENEKKTVTLKKTVVDSTEGPVELYEVTLFYKVKVTESNVYTLSFGDDEYSLFNNATFYEDGKEAEFDYDGWGYILKAGKEYCLNLEIMSDSLSKTAFKIVPAPDHTHTYGKAKIIKAATTKADGKKTETCKVCGNVKTSKIAKIASVTLDTTKYAYDGKAKTPKVTVRDSAGKTLKNGTDYTVSYSNNKAIGKASAKITFKGGYSAAKTLTYKIVPAKVSGLKASQTQKSIKLSWSAVKGAEKYKVFTYSAKTKKYKEIGSTKKTSFTVSSLKSGTAHTYYVKAYKKVGDTYYPSADYAKITTATKTAAPKISAINSEKNKASLSWKKISGADGYEVYTSSSKSGTFRKLSSTTKLSYTNYFLKSGSTVYYKVRAYKTVDSSKIYSDFSTVRSVKIK